MKNESQYGLLLLQRYLYEHTDDQHPASVADILAFWREHGIQAGRKSVYSAIEGNRQSRQRLDRHGTIVVGSCETFHHYNVQGVK